MPTESTNVKQNLLITTMYVGTISQSENGLQGCILEIGSRSESIRWFRQARKDREATDVCCRKSANCGRTTCEMGEGEAGREGGLGALVFCGQVCRLMCNTVPLARTL
jgi:hypothetical protein